MLYILFFCEISIIKHPYKNEYGCVLVPVGNNSVHGKKQAIIKGIYR